MERVSSEFKSLGITIPISLIKAYENKKISWEIFNSLAILDREIEIWWKCYDNKEAIIKTIANNIRSFENHVEKSPDLINDRWVSIILLDQLDKTTSEIEAVLNRENTQDKELNIEKTIIPNDLKIEKTMKGNEIWYTFNKPLYLPYDKNLLSKIEKDAKIPIPYFTNVLQSFIEDILPNIFAKGYYNTMKLDREPYRIDINSNNNHNFPYSFNLDFSKNEDLDIDNLPKQYENMTINTSVFITSEILHHPIKNGFFPLTKEWIIQPVHGIQLRTTRTEVELPGILSSNESVFITELSTPFFEKLLLWKPLFFPNHKDYWEKITWTKGKFWWNSPAIKLTDSEFNTIKTAKEFRNELALFLINNREEIISLIEEFSEAKKYAGISSDRSLENYKPDFLYTHFHEIDWKFQEFSKKLPDSLKSHETLQNKKKN